MMAGSYKEERTKNWRERKVFIAPSLNAVKKVKQQKLSDYVWFKEYLENHGIEYHRNNLDIILSGIKRNGGNLYNGRTVGNIRFADGTKKTFIAYDDEIIELDKSKFSQPNYRYRQKGVWKADDDKELKLNKDWNNAKTFSGSV